MKKFAYLLIFTLVSLSSADVLAQEIDQPAVEDNQVKLDDPESVAKAYLAQKENIDKDELATWRIIMGKGKASVYLRHGAIITVVELVKKDNIWVVEGVEN